MPTSSARPANLESFVTGSRAADGELRSDEAKTRAAYAKFAETCTWGTLDAESLLNGYDQYVALNAEDARWSPPSQRTSAAPAGAVQSLHCRMAQSQRACATPGLSDERQSLTFDAPVAYGMPPTSGYANDPVNTGTGNFVEPEIDLAFNGLVAGLSFTRTYNSRSDRGGAFGPGWSSWASVRLRAQPEGVEYEGPDGQRAVFPRMGAGYGRVVGVNALVEPIENGLALNWFGGGGRWEFDAAGWPARIERGPGTEVRLRHDDECRLVQLTHAGGKRVDVEWDGERISAATCSDGRYVGYVYDDLDNLVEVERDGGARRYEVDLEGRIVSVTYADGVVEVVNSYDDDGRVVEQLSPFGRHTHFTYLPSRVTVTSDVSDGPANTYVHDLAGRVLAIVDGDEQQTTFNYDEWGNPVAITERGGAVTIQEWDDRVRLTRRVLPTGASFTFAYDDLDRVRGGRRVQRRCHAPELFRRAAQPRRDRRPRRGRHPADRRRRSGARARRPRRCPAALRVRRRRQHRRHDRRRRQRRPAGTRWRRPRHCGRHAAGHRTAFFYDNRGRLVERHDPTGAVWSYEYTAAGRLTRVTDPTGAVQEIGYGEHGCPIAAVDPLGHVTARHYDVFGNVVGVVAPDGASWEYGYDALMRPTTIVDPVGGTWGCEYDVNGNLIGSVDPVGTHCTATIDPAGQVTAVSDGLTSSAFEFDEFGRAVVAHVRPDGSRARCEYDRCGRRTTIEDPLGGITRNEYSPGGKVRRETAPSGRVDELEYDGCGRVAARIDGAGRRWEYRYDADGALTEQIEPTGEVARFTYDAGGRLKEWSAPGRGVTSYAYDEGGRTTAVTDRVAGTRRFDHDGAGRLIAATDANGATMRCSYDARGWMTEIVYPLGGVTARSYDAAGRLVAETDPLGRVTTLTYDAAGRLVERVDGSGRATRWPTTRPAACAPSEPLGATRSRSSATRSAVQAIDESGAPTNRLGWDEGGRLVERSRGELAMRWRYTADGERAAVGYPDGTETTYSYDAGGFLNGQHHPALGAIAFERDAAGRLISATGDGMRARWRYDDGDIVVYEFEAAGRRRTAQLTRDPVGRVVAATVDGDQQRFAYDLAGQLLSAQTRGGLFSFSYDANGRLECKTSRTGTVEYEYDAAGQLMARRSGASVQQAFQYDGAGRRIREADDEFSRTWRCDELGRLVRVDSCGPEARERATNVTLDALGELAEVDGTPLLWDTADAFAPLTWMDGQAVIGNGTPWALARGGATEWLAPDWQGTIGGANRDPWGAPTAPDSGTGLRLGYRGELESRA